MIELPMAGSGKNAKIRKKIKKALLDLFRPRVCVLL